MLYLIIYLFAVFTPEQLTEKYSNLVFLLYCFILMLVVAANQYIYRWGIFFLVESETDFIWEPIVCYFGHFSYCLDVLWPPSAIFFFLTYNSTMQERGASALCFWTRPDPILERFAAIFLCRCFWCRRIVFSAVCQITVSWKFRIDPERTLAANYYSLKFCYLNAYIPSFSSPGLTCWDWPWQAIISFIAGSHTPCFSCFSVQQDFG